MQQQTVHQQYQVLLVQYQARMTELKEQDVAAFNSLLREKGIPNLITGRTARPVS